MKKYDPEIVEDFINKLRTSRGLNVPAMLREAEEKFGKNPEILKLIIDCGKKQQMQLVVDSKTQEGQVLRQYAYALARKASANSGIISQFKQSLEIYMKFASGDQNITPEQINNAKQILAAGVGLSDEMALTDSMIQTLAESLNVITVRNPETE